VALSFIIVWLTYAMWKAWMIGLKSQEWTSEGTSKALFLYSVYGTIHVCSNPERAGTRSE
jgi:hypothetical protein